MKKTWLLSTLLLCSSSLQASYGFFFIDKNHPAHIDTDGRYVGKADLKTDGFRGSQLQFADSHDMAYYSFFPNETNSLTVGLGYNFMRVDWDKNPRFKGSDYNYATGTLTWVSKSIESWRWVTMGGFTVDAEDLDFHKTGAGYGLLWGRYLYNDDIGIHVGAIAYGGMRNGYALPVFGIDWQAAKALRFHAIFPVDLSARLYLHKNWYISAASTPFGYPYRYPHRAHGGIGKYKDAIFEFYSQGAELSINYFQGFDFEAGVGGGWNFPGWLLIKDRHNDHPRYYKFKGAPFAHAYLNFSF